MDNSKVNNLIKRLSQALTSTERVISDDFTPGKAPDDDKNSKKTNFFNLEKLNSKNDFIQARAESDSSALKKNFQTKMFIKKIYPLIHLVNHYTQ